MLIFAHEKAFDNEKSDEFNNKHNGIVVYFRLDKPISKDEGERRI